MILSLDLGSRHCGIAALIDALPVRVIAAKTLDVNPADLDPTAAQILGAIDLAVQVSRDRGERRPRIVIEWGRFYVPQRGTPALTAAAGAAMGEARDPMICMRDRVEQRCKVLGVEVLRIPAKTWRARIGCRGRDDAAVAEALAVHTPLSALEDEHQRDAVGAAAGVLLGEDGQAPMRRAGAKRSRTPPRVLARRAAEALQDAAADAMLTASVAAVDGLALPPGIRERERVR